MLIFWRLVLAHFIADFSLQTNKVATWKRESRWGMIFHTMTHPLVSIVLLLLPVDLNFKQGWFSTLLNEAWVTTPWFSLNGWLCIAIIAFTHWAEDEWRVWSIQETGSPDSTGFFLWDQLVHLAIILALSPTSNGLPAERWIFPVLCAVLLAHFTSVLIYFIENDVWKKSEVLRARKYLFMLERFVGAALLLLPGYWAVLGLVWVGAMIVRYLRNRQDRTWVHALVANSSVLVLGGVSRLFLL